MPKSVTLDAADHALLAEIQRDNQTPARVLAEKLGLSESAVLRRLRRLRREKVVVADVAVVDPAVLGTPLTILVLVSLEREGTARLDAFVRKLRERPEVKRAWYVTGEADFVLELRVADMGAYEAFSREVLLDDANLRSFRTIVSMREVVGPGA
ncbi:Lrp/AsnC family transcriptional regulator [Acetobacteraceae bacterium H6797]|nr:Lrp/AsnC family transcriptional regulator [Acetobacteraceae bacterium H6797]